MQTKYNTDDLRICATKEVIPPAQVHYELPIIDTAAQSTLKARAEIHKILTGEDDRLLVLAGDAGAERFAEVGVERLLALGVLVGVEVGLPLGARLAVRRNRATGLAPVAVRTDHAVIDVATLPVTFVGARSERGAESDRRKGEEERFLQFHRVSFLLI